MATDSPTAMRAGFDSGAWSARVGASGPVRKWTDFVSVVVGSAVSIRTPTPTLAA